MKSIARRTFTDAQFWADSKVYYKKCFWAYYKIYFLIEKIEKVSKNNFWFRRTYDQHPNITV